MLRVLRVLRVVGLLLLLLLLLCEAGMSVTVKAGIGLGVVERGSCGSRRLEGGWTDSGGGSSSDGVVLSGLKYGPLLLLLLRLLCGRYRLLGLLLLLLLWLAGLRLGLLLLLGVVGRRVVRRVGGVHFEHWSVMEGRIRC